MATRKSTSNSRTSSKKKNNKKKKNQQSMSFTSEIVILALAAILIVLELSNFGLCGAVSYITNFLFGVFGIVQYILPIYIIVMLGFIYINEGSYRALNKALFITLLTLTISIFAQLIRNPLVDSIKAIYMDCSASKLGGGVIGGGIAMLLIKGIGIVGTYVLMIFLLAIIIMVIFEVSFLDMMKNLVEYVRDRQQYDDEDEYEEEYIAKQEKKQERKQERQDSKAAKKKAKKSVLGSIQVLPSEEEQLANKIDKEKLAKEDIHEITMDFEDNDFEDINIATVSPITTVPSSKMDVISADSVFSNEEEVIEVKTPTRKRRTPTVKDMEILAENTMETESIIRETSETHDNYEFPPLSLLKKGSGDRNGNDASAKATAAKLQSVLASFGINVTITNYSQGPAVTRYEMQPEQGVKVSKITGLSDDIMLNLAADSIRIEAPIPGKAAIGIEIPNRETKPVMFRDLIDSDAFRGAKSNISFAVGKDISGQIMVSDIAKMPHLLIAGATGSGKSVCINTLIMSILYRAHPDDVKLIMIDPKVVELSSYNGIPHLLIPVVTDPKKAAGALNWAVAQMTERYKLFAEYNVRNLEGYNKKVKEVLAEGGDPEHIKKLPLIVIIVDELADLMMVAHGEVEDAIVRLSQLARAAGIHLVIATQRPSVDVITGLIKANVPSRIAFSVSSGVDSRTILDMIGAEKLLGKGDMLFYPTGYPKPVRVQGAFISDEEVGKVVDFLIKKNGQTTYDDTIKEQITSAENTSAISASGGSNNDRDEYFVEAGRFIIEKDKASIGMLQRVYKIGFNRAARIMDQLYEAGVVGEEEGTKPRKVIMSMEEFEQYIEEYV